MTLDVDEIKVGRAGLILWLEWTAATVAGMLLGFLPFALFIENLDLLVARLLVPIWAGVLVGTFQWLVLRQFLTHSADWILHGGASWALAYALGLLTIQALGNTPVGVLFGYVLFGLIMAVMQWPVLRREIPNLTPWLLANVVGWALGAKLGEVGLGLLATGGTVNLALSAGVIAGITGLTAGAITGMALVWIVRQPEHSLAAT